MIDCFVHGDTSHPRFQSLRFVLREGHINAHEHVLCYVFGVLRIVKNPVNDMKQIIAVLFNECAKGLFIAGEDLSDRLFISINGPPPPFAVLCLI